jgi:hypothetical protein
MVLSAIVLTMVDFFMLLMCSSTATTSNISSAKETQKNTFSLYNYPSRGDGYRRHVGAGQGVERGVILVRTLHAARFQE